jgi:hypothetical protein
MRHGLRNTDGHREKKLISLSTCLSSIETAYLCGDSIFFQDEQEDIECRQIVLLWFRTLTVRHRFSETDHKTLECKTFFTL